jgi:mannose-6-phosphate isomerase-like protein (cupin superfamily)
MVSTTIRNVIPFSMLYQDGLSKEFEGYKFGITNLTFIVLELTPGDGPKLHSHPYMEIIIVLEGTALITIGDKESKVTGGNVVIVPSEVPHKFVNTGNCNLKQLDIHLNEKFITNWLE